MLLYLLRITGSWPCQILQCRGLCKISCYPTRWRMEVLSMPARLC
ncbi:unnamed protein product, partial [Vitis vinifera]|uniref:Uncharacterized protein n=1 Tax=Vitis vinifera TaxID=29760 RepID=D7SUF6_VITVI